MFKKGFLLILSLLIFFQCINASDKNPYEIYKNHLKAKGYENRIEWNSFYLEANTEYVNYTVCTSYTWSDSSYKLRAEVICDDLLSVSGDNGKYSWTINTNGKIQILNSAEDLIQREVKKKFEGKDFLKEDSSIFNLIYLGIEKIDTILCYKIQITNDITLDTIINYIDTVSLMSICRIERNSTEFYKTINSDFRNVHGYIMPFKQDMIYQPSGVKILYKLMRYEINLPVESLLFEPVLRK